MTIHQISDPKTLFPILAIGVDFEGLVMEKYEFVKELNAGSNYSVTKLMRNKQTEEVVAMKFIELGPQVYSFLHSNNSVKSPILVNLYACQNSLYIDIYCYFKLIYRCMKLW